MKLLQINTSLSSSAIGKISNQIGEILIENGHESFLAFGSRGRNLTTNSETVKIGTVLDFYWHAVVTRLFDKHGFASKYATKKFIKRIDLINPDIIHIHNLHGYYINIDILLNHLSIINKPVIWTLHDCWTFTGHCSHFEYVSCVKWKTACSHCPQKRSYPSSLLLDNSKNNFIRKKHLINSIKNIVFVPVSNWLNDQLNESFLSTYPRQVIHNGIDTNIFQPRNFKYLISKYKLHDKFILLGVASVWSEKKGFFEFLKLRKILSDDFQIILVGVDSKLKKKLPKNIISIEKTSDQQQLAMIYSCADLFLNLTLEDTYPTTNMESIACGTPVITYKTGGSPESVSKDFGYIVNRGDILKVKKIIESLSLGDIPMITKDKLLKGALARFDKNRNFRNYVKLYDQVLKE